LRAKLLSYWQTGGHTLDDLLKRAPGMKRSSLHHWLSAQPNPRNDGIDGFYAEMPSEEFVMKGQEKRVLRMARAIHAMKRGGAPPGPRYASVKWGKKRQFARTQHAVIQLLKRQETE
jgi:hypothetical protein